MKKIIQILSQYLKEAPHWKLYFICFVFCMGMVVLQYQFDFPFDFFSTHVHQNIELVGFILLFGTAFLFPLLIEFLLNRQLSFTWNKTVVLHILFIILAFSFRMYFYQYASLIAQVKVTNLHFKHAVADNLFQALALLVPIVLIYLLSERDTHFYGLFKRPDTIKPYLYILLIMLPIVWIASTQHQFQVQYPKYRTTAALGTHDGMHIFLFNLFYLFDFIIIELFFRGYIILALKKHIGPSVMMPMVCMYVAIHLWKPAGETISSFFGGFVLGVLAYKTESIWGGIIAHCGVALMMEVFGSFYLT